MTALKYSVQHGKEKISIKKAAEIVEMSEPAVRNYVVNHGCETIESIIKKRDSPRRRAGTPFKKLKTSRGMMTFPEILKAHEHTDEISGVTLRGRISRRGSHCPSLWYPKLSSYDFRLRLAEDGLEGDPSKQSPFATEAPSIQRDTCRKGWTQCEHYKECTDTLCFDHKVPDRYREDKSCYGDGD